MAETKRPKSDNKPLAAPPPGSLEAETKKALDAQPTVRIRPWQVPEGSTDEPLPDLTVAINGYIFQYKRGEYHEVPQTVADILAEAGHA